MIFEDLKVIPQIDTGKTFLSIPASGTTAASPFDCRGFPPLAFVTQPGWLACNVTFQVLPYLLPGIVYTAGLPSNAQLAPVYDQSDSGLIYSIVTGNDYGYYRLPAALFNSVRYINITASVAQPAINVNLVLPALWQGIHS